MRLDMKMHAEQGLEEVVALDADDHLARPFVNRCVASEETLFQVRVDCILPRGNREVRTP